MTCISTIALIKVGMAQMEEALGGLPKYWDSLREVREENLRHSQLATAKENLRSLFCFSWQQVVSNTLFRHIFTVPETVAKTEVWIEEGKLLQVLATPEIII